MTQGLFFLLNHLWQSTLIAGVAWLVCRTMLKANSPRVRFGVWLAASLKFPIPFAAFVSVGHWLAVRPLLKPSQSQQVFEMVGAGTTELAAAPFRVSQPWSRETGSHAVGSSCYLGDGSGDGRAPMAQDVGDDSPLRMKSETGWRLLRCSGFEVETHARRAD